ncbi:unnamed protein product [Anisakis simplex]|uniref:HTH OST-type domain-containing protein n=1 Tax=Anisakis simplex TaxID=6269 RepID=A0A0M3JZ45_ANISI|nr:unnamed protein product [Anisakis simplex]
MSASASLKLVSLIMRALHINPCQCTQCAMHPLIANAAQFHQANPTTNIFNKINKSDSSAHSSNQVASFNNYNNDVNQLQSAQSKARGDEDTDCTALLATLFSSNPPVLSDTSSIQQPHMFYPLKQQQSATDPQQKLIPIFDNSNTYTTQDEDSTTRTLGRRNKHYKTLKERKEIAEYGRMHGASAAARRYDVPVYAAQYYVRTHARFERSGEANGTNAQGEMKRTSPSNESRRMLNSSNDQSKQRSRGRPRLLGDELDGELLDYLAKVKRTLPGGHLSVTKALDLSRHFIEQRSPGLLVEYGGEVSLRFSWASVLVRRIAERELDVITAQNADSNHINSTDTANVNTNDVNGSDNNNSNPDENNNGSNSHNNSANNTLSNSNISSPNEAENSFVNTTQAYTPADQAVMEFVDPKCDASVASIVAYNSVKSESNEAIDRTDTQSHEVSID